LDKLRAIQYFVAAAEEGSFSGAARRLQVSIPAIAKLINGLEHSLGARLFDRASQGLTLTADGVRYLEACQPLLEQVAAADEAVAGAAVRARGSLVIGTQPQLALHCLGPTLPRFHARHPDIQLDVRVVNRINDADASAVDVFVLLGWPEQGDLVHRRIAETRQLVCASPEYWTRHGKPEHPQDLAGHQCFTFRNPEGTVIDLWRFTKDGRAQNVTVSGWLTSNHRDVNLDAVLAGEGVARISDLSAQPLLASGRLVPVLRDWEMKDAPPVNLFYRASHRRSARMRAFIDHVTAVFRDLEAQRDHGADVPVAERPEWYGRRYGHVSASLRGRK
jgi:DNA-binding transcriptional LysR family regulator